MKEYHELTNESKETITKCFNDGDLEELFDFIENGICIVAGIHTIKYMENLVRKYGSHVLLNNCNNCAKSTTTCDAQFALDVCGEGLFGWEEKV